MTEVTRQLTADTSITEEGAIRMEFASRDAVTSDGYHWKPDGLRARGGGDAVYIRMQHNSDDPLGVGVGRIRYDAESGRAVLEGKLYPGQDGLREKLLALKEHGLPQASMGVSWLREHQRSGKALSASDPTGATTVVDQAEVSEISLVDYGALPNTQVAANSAVAPDPRTALSDDVTVQAELRDRLDRAEAEITTMQRQIEALRMRGF